MKKNLLFLLVFLLSFPAIKFFAQCDPSDEITYLSDNLFVNSSFENGNQDINSAQSYFGDCANNTGNQKPNFYAIPASGSSPQDCNSFWTPNLNAQDGNRYMISNFPHKEEGVNLWCQKIETELNTDYEFKGYFANVLNELRNNIDPIIKVEVNGDVTNTGIIFNSQSEFAIAEGLGWLEATSTFNSGENTVISVCIQNVNFARGGHDLAIDNLSLKSIKCEPNTGTNTDADVKFYDCDEQVEEHNAAVLNGSFENGSFALWENGATNFGADQIDHWNTANWTNNIYLFATGHNDVPAYEGDTYAEANAYQVSSLYQDIATVPGDIIHYSFAHRGRDGQDMIGVYMGIPRPKPEEPIDSELINTYTTDNDRWIVYEGKYEVPKDQTVTRFSLKAMKSASGDLTRGNLLDAVTVQSINASCPNPMSGNIEVCDNGIDDDNDGLVDSADTDCSTSGGNNGGLESNGRLAEKIFQRNLNRRIEPSTAKNKKSEMTHKKRTSAYGVFNQANQRSLMSIESFIPVDTISNSETYISSPTDLQSITNATEVFSVDIFRDNSRLAAIFATVTEKGVYEHTKYICDRLKGGIINDLKTEKIGYSDFIIADIVQPEGNREYALSFSARETADGKLDIQSHWSLENYPQDDSYYNFQIWAASMDDLKALTLKTMQLLHEYKSIKSMTTTAAPSVFVSKGEYRNGKLDLKLINKTGSNSITLIGEKSQTETMNKEAINTTTAIEGYYSEYVTLEVGSVYDMGFRIKHDNDTVFDDLFIADGLWFLDTKEGNLSYEVAPASDVITENTYPLERSIEVSGTFDNTLSIYRSMKPNFRAVDVSKFNTLHFNVSGKQAMQIVLIKNSISDWDAQYKTSISTSGGSNEVSIPLSRFSNGTGEEINLTDIQAIIFKFEGDGNSKNLNIEISSLDFRNQEDDFSETAFDNANMIVTPNPSNSDVTIQWLSNTEGLHHGLLLDINGRTIQKFEGLTSRGHNQIYLERNNLTSGVYFFSIIEQTGKIISDKIVLID